jgi:hypothetical protein
MKKLVLVPPFALALAACADRPDLVAPDAFNADPCRCRRIE